MPIKSPFDSAIAKPGQGSVVLSLLPPSRPSLSTLTYQYPLKLLTRSPAFIPESSVLENATQPVHLHLLSYGGGLLPGDVLEVSIRLERRTRLVLTTPQGSTKIYKTKPRAAAGMNHHHNGGYSNSKHTGNEAFDGAAADTSKQTLRVHVENEAALCYLPDPSVPFRHSRYEQDQKFTVNMDMSQGQTTSSSKSSSICVLDWVTQGRGSLGEDWDFHLWRGKNEVWTTDKKSGKKKLLLRDSVILNDGRGDDDCGSAGSGYGSRIRERVYPNGIVGTLILYGPVFENLSCFIMDTFASQPRIGGRDWSSSSSSSSSFSHQAYASTATADTQTRSTGPHDVTWTAARVRAGFVLVKFGARDFETAKEWLGGLFRKEGSVVREFGEEALWSL